ncbi:concanavalin A-like lectin/glucanase domain-containing protein [Massariosphaeria phaeospora]|uniref:Concanavalin A-like lectin/glucanase domain-containing protein n=1 Tax=Massariosphaeria phaeospora TaxID=100035 RepID=A0A7C8IC77_9PLEO|nr:concanavalin A-like lectin/glucanase domain-containing protein [Massariosphaeria phaeospora]
MLHRAVGAVPWLLLAVPRLANAACECGYSLNKTTDADHAVFTDLMENDFLHTSLDNVTEAGWRPQQYNMSSEASRGPFGKNFSIPNVETNAFKQADAWSGESEKGGDAGLKLWVRGDHSRGFVNSAEMASVRDDAAYGSFRVGLKLSAQSGTCGAFFWYHNNSQEIDMEFLSKQFNQSQGTVNLVLQTPESVEKNYDASNTSEFKVQALPFRPDEKFHEYRFDWSPGRVAFYVDGTFHYEMTNNLPTQGGRFLFNHWSNGDPLWSAGPPGADTAMTISYMKSYFNSTDPARHDVHKGRCPTYDPAKVCAIPEQTKAPDPSEGPDGAKTYFFTKDGPDKVPGQIVYRQTSYEGAATSLFASPSIYLSLLVTFFSCIIVI